MPSIPLAIQDELAEAIRFASEFTKLNQQETMRQAIRLGLPVMIKKWPGAKAHCNPAIRRGKKGGAK
jgi:hypothetical protein